MNNKVLACLDHSSYTTSVCDYACWAADRLTAQLEFIHVLDRHPETAQKLDFTGNIGLGTQESLLDELAALDEKRGAITMERGRLLLEAAKSRAVADGNTTPQARQRHGELVETLAELEGDVRMFVLGKRGEAGDRSPQHLGTNLERVVRALHRPILVVPTEFATPKRIMIAFDGSMTTRKGIEMIASSPLFKDLDCHVVMVGSDTPVANGHLEWARETLVAGGVRATRFIIGGDPETALPEHARRNNIDVLVMGAYGHSRIRRLLVGSTTTEVIRTSLIPVLLLR